MCKVNQYLLPTTDCDLSQVTSRCALTSICQPDGLGRSVDADGSFPPTFGLHLDVSPAEHSDSVNVSSFSSNYPIDGVTRQGHLCSISYCFLPPIIEEPTMGCINGCFADGDGFSGIQGSGLCGRVLLWSDASVVISSAGLRFYHTSR